MSYYVYENWQAEGHKARIHIATCHSCNNGQGIHTNSSDKHGRWHGPFSSFQAAFDAAHKTGGHVSSCKFCLAQ